jgi:glutamate formiminotransferase
VRGEYEGIVEKRSDGFWTPDCGPVILNHRRGATIIGTREYPGQRKSPFSSARNQKLAQISMNLANYHVTPPHLVPERARQLAADRGLAVTGSETVSMILCAALLEAGKYYLARQGHSYTISAIEILETAIGAMGLRDVRPFDVQRKVIGLA